MYRRDNIILRCFIFGFIIHIYRYSPTESKRTFPVLGVTIVHQPHDECNRRHCSISLGQLNSYSTGVYKCEVSGDAPAFPVVYDSRNMTVYGKAF